MLGELNKEITVQIRGAATNQNEYLSQKKTEINLVLDQVKQKILTELEIPLEEMNQNELATDQTSQKKKTLLASLLSQLNLTESEKKKINNNSLVQNLKISVFNS